VQAQFQNEDLLIGKSFFGDTMAVVRGGSIVADPFTQPFIAGMDFDNTGGINNNLAGNLVMLDRGFPAGSGAVYIGATDGSGTMTLVGDWSGGFPGFNDVLASADFMEQVAVSPDNSKIAITTAGDGGNGFLLLFDYDPTMVGVDNTAVLTNGRSLNNAWFAFGLHEVEWTDNDTLLMVDGDAAFVDTIDLDPNGNFDVGSRTRHRELLGPLGGQQPLDSDSAPVAYNPEISPYVYVGAGDFDQGIASNYVWVLDPTQTELNGDWKQIARARYDGDTDPNNPGQGFNQGIRPSNTIRDMELLSNGNLAVTMFGGSLYTLDMSTLDGSACGDPANFDLPDGGCGGLVDDTGATMVFDGDIVFDDPNNPNGISDNGFTLMTIARTALGTPGDFDGDDDVDGDDFLFWQRDPSVGDLADWEANYGFVPPPLSATSIAVPEPSTGMVLLIGMLGMLCRRKLVAISPNVFGEKE
jgi:hypothetical protein